MKWYFDFHTQSITTGYTLAEYLQLIAQSRETLGLHIWEPIAGNRSDALRFRHEHAHFTSYMASGLADLYGVFSDYLLVLTYTAIRRQASLSPGSPLKVPLLNAEGGGTLPKDVRIALLKAWNQITGLRAFLFGFGSRASLNQLLDSVHQDDFWATHFELRFAPIVQRFYRLLKCLAVGAETEQPDYGSSPQVMTPLGNRGLSARSVMEAYAISIELMNTYCRGVKTSLNYMEEVTRNPGPLYIVAIEHLLANAFGENSITWSDFAEGRAPQTCYYTVAAIAFASMQVPVMQGLDGEVTISGTFNALSPAHRFCRLVAALGNGTLKPLPDGTRGSNKRGFLSWLRNCHRIVGDTDSMRMCKLALHEHKSNEELREKHPRDKTCIDISWAARANFFANPNEYVTDAGLFAEKYICQVRYVRTSDGKLAMLGEHELAQSTYWGDHSPLMLEAAVFGEQWDSLWPKFPELTPLDRLAHIKGAIAYAAWTFGDTKEASFRLPEIELCIEAN